MQPPRIYAEQTARTLHGVLGAGFGDFDSWGGIADLFEELFAEIVDAANAWAVMADATQPLNAEEPLMDTNEACAVVSEVGDMIASAIGVAPIGETLAEVLEPLAEDIQLAHDHFANGDC